MRVGQAGNIIFVQGARSEWQTGTFDALIVNAVVVMGLISFNGNQQTVPSIRNVIETGFEVQMTEWENLNGLHTKETTACVALQAGTQQLKGGGLAHAGKTSASDAWQDLDFALTDTGPQDPPVGLDIPDATHVVRGGVTEAVDDAAPDPAQSGLHVSAERGSLDGDGSYDKPFLTIPQARWAVSPGDTVFVHECTYRETPRTDVSCTDDAKITFTNWGDDRVIVTAIDVIEGWVQDPGNPDVYSIDAVADLASFAGVGSTIVFVDGVPLVEARWTDVPDAASAVRGGREMAAMAYDGGMVDTVAKIGSDEDASLEALDGVDLVGATLHTDAGEAWWDQELTMTGHETATNAIEFDMSSVDDSWSDGTAEP